MCGNQSVRQVAVSHQHSLGSVPHSNGQVRRHGCEQTVALHGHNRVHSACVALQPLKVTSAVANAAIHRLRSQAAPHRELTVGSTEYGKTEYVTATDRGLFRRLKLSYNHPRPGAIVKAWQLQSRRPGRSYLRSRTARCRSLVSNRSTLLTERAVVGGSSDATHAACATKVPSLQSRKRTRCSGGHGVLT